MKFKYFIIISYFISSLITIISVIFAVKKMLLVESEAYFIIFVTILSSIIGALFILMILSKIFSSLNRLTYLVKNISYNKYETIDNINEPLEFKELAIAYNDMAINLKNTFDSLNESEKEKDTIISQLSHDIKTPITSIQSTVEGILDGIIKKEEQIKYLKTIKRQTERLNKLVEQLNHVTLYNDFNKNDLLKQDIIVLDKLLLDILSEFSVKIEKENREINVSINTTITKITSNYEKISRIILNILDNSLKYSPEGTPINIIAEEKDNKFFITIEDKGLGIKKEQLSKIFDRLYRVESSRNMSTGGYGLGLYIARELASQIKGDIFVDSVFGVGSKFSLVLYNY